MFGNSTDLQAITYIPHPALREYVLNISTVHAALPADMTDAVSPYPPTPFQSLMFYCNNPVSMSPVDYNRFEEQPLIVVIGPQFSRVNVKVHRVIRAIRVDFCPGGMYRMLGITMHTLFDKGFDALDIFGAEMKQIQEQLQHISELEDGRIIVENFLLKQVTKLKPAMPFDHAMIALLKTNGAMTMEKAASLSCLSLKQFERKSQERIGMNPKTFARILRFSHAYRMHEATPALSWTAIAHAAGYFDQMHMIRDFKVFAGVNPSVIVQQLRDTPLRMQKDLRY